MTNADEDIEEQHHLQRIAAVAGKTVTTVVYAYVVVVEIILGLGFVLLLFGANPSSGLVEWVYRSMDRAMKPFRGIFEPIELGVTGNDVPSILETSVLFAMIIYAIVAIALSSLLHWLSTRINRIDTDNRVREVERAHRDAEAAYRQAMLQSQLAASAARSTTPPPGAPTSEMLTEPPRPAD